jgi:hypothetical protein
MRLGVGGGVFGIRGGISTRGLGVGVGPFSAGTSWRRGGSGGSGFFAWLIVAMFVILIVAWPYLLGSYIAVQLGAGDASTARAAVGWFFQILYIAGLIAWFVLTERSEHSRFGMKRSGSPTSPRQGSSTRRRRVARWRTGTSMHREPSVACHGGKVPQRLAP